MKLAKILLIIGGVTNALFFLFHLWLGWRLHRTVGLPPGVQPLLEMLNGGGALFIMFLAVASLGCPVEVLTSRLGRLVLVTVVALYGLRALAEFVVAQRTTPAIVATCVATSLLYAGAWVASGQKPEPTVAPA